MTKNGKRGCTEVSGNMMLCYREQPGQNGGRPVRGYKTRHQGADHAFRYITPGAPSLWYFVFTRPVVISGNALAGFWFRLFLMIVLSRVMGAKRYSPSVG